MSNDALTRAWDQAMQHPGTAVDIGRVVVCDGCSRDFTESAEQGGVIFCSKGYCPTCTPRLLADAKRYGEEHAIKARCPDGVSFADFVRQYRGGNNSIVVTKMVSPSCRQCKQEFTNKNVHTAAGWREIAISGMCEDCFDAMFAEVDNEP